MAEGHDNRLRLFVERIERLLEERRGISEDIRAVYDEAKAVGYSASTIRTVIARRAMKPDDRAEADAMLECYEAALGMGGAAADAAIRTVSPDAASLASLLLAEQIDGLSEPERAAVLVDHVLFLLDLRAEIRELRSQEGSRKKLAGAEGFDSKALGRVVQWFEKVARHGLAAMRLGEENFRLYRGTMDARQADPGAAVADPRLAALFAPAPARAPSAKIRNLSSARMAAEMARRAANGEI